MEEIFEENRSKAWELEPEATREEIEHGERIFKTVVDREMLNRDVWDGIGRSDDEVRLIIELYIQHVSSFQDPGFKGSALEFESQLRENELAQWYAQKFLPLREPPMGT